jgi:hypothetical protein
VEGEYLEESARSFMAGFCKCFVKSSLESNTRPRYCTVLDQGMVTFWI